MIKLAKMPKNMKSSNRFRTVFVSAVLCQLYLFTIFETKKMLLAVDVGEALAVQRDGIQIYAGFDLKTTVRRSRRKTIFILLSLSEG